MYSEQVDHDKNEYLTKKNHFSSWILPKLSSFTCGNNRKYKYWAS
jgi:hypothetical protein